MLDYLPAILAAIMMQQGVFNLNIDNNTVTDTKNHQMWLYEAQDHGERSAATNKLLDK